jgi:hypothetical protein
MSYSQENLKTYFKPKIHFILDTSKIKSPIYFIPKYNVNNQPIFCKIEELWQRNTNFNVRFRLGSIDYVDRLENKNNITQK